MSWDIVAVLGLLSPFVLVAAFSIWYHWFSNGYFESQEDAVKHLISAIEREAEYSVELFCDSISESERFAQVVRQRARAGVQFLLTIFEDAPKSLRELASEGYLTIVRAPHRLQSAMWIIDGGKRIFRYQQYQPDLCERGQYVEAPRAQEFVDDFRAQAA